MTERGCYKFLFPVLQKPYMKAFAEPKTKFLMSLTIEIKDSMEEIAGICLKYKIELLAINPQHLDQIANLPQIHGNPFDRLLISQAITEKLTIVTRDSIIPKYNVNTIW